mgnify:FL=1
MLDTKAKEYFQKAIQTANDSLKKNALLCFAEGAEQNSEFSLSANLYEQLATFCNDSLNSPQALFLAGKIYEEKLFDYEKARTTFDEIGKQFPNHQLVDDALYFSTVCNDSLHNYEKAIQKFSSIEKK